MADPTRRQLIVAEMLARVRTIRIVNGFATDCGEKVIQGEVDELGPDDPPQAIALIIGDEQQDWQGPGLAFFCTLPFSIRALASADLDEPFWMIEALVGDIKRAVETSDLMFGGLLPTPFQRGPVMALDRQPGSKTVGAAVIYRCSWKETFGAP